MKTGIMGGTFNPIHNGHLILAEHVMEEFGLDEIWFMPNGNPPHKRPEQTGIRTGDRLAMVKLAIEGIPAFSSRHTKQKSERYLIPTGRWSI